MKPIKALLIGAAALVSSAAGAQNYSEASVSGTTLSYGPAGFMLQGPDGNYGIEVTSATVITNRWNTYDTGPQSVLPGEVVTAYGYPTSQWTLQATEVVVLGNEYVPTYPGSGGYGVNNPVVPSNGTTPFPFRVDTGSSLSTQLGNTFLP